MRLQYRLIQKCLGGMFSSAEIQPFFVISSLPSYSAVFATFLSCNFYPKPKTNCRLVTVDIFKNVLSSALCVCLTAELCCSHRAETTGDSLKQNSSPSYLSSHKEGPILKGQCFVFALFFLVFLQTVTNKSCI